MTARGKIDELTERIKISHAIFIQSAQAKLDAEDTIKDCMDEICQAKELVEMHDLKMRDHRNVIKASKEEITKLEDNIQ